MKNKLIIVFIFFLFWGCTSPSVSPSYFYLKNTSNLSINVTFYNNRIGKISQLFVDVGQTSLIETVDGNDAQRSVSSMGTDSVKVVFSDGKKKTDVHCGNERLSSTVLAQCLQDNINLYNRMESRNGSTIYKIDNADYLEAR